MEDAAEALKLAFSVFAFVIALGIAFTTFNQSREVSDIIIKRNDNTYLEAYFEASNEEAGRTVGVENLIPTLYRYYKEDCTIEIVQGDTIQELFDLETERKCYNMAVGYGKDNEYHNKNFEELYPKISWIGSATEIDVKLRVDAYISCEEKDINNTQIDKYTKFGNGLGKSNFSRTYYQTFGETYTGNRYSFVNPNSPDYDGTFFVTESGKTKVKLIYTY